MSGSERLQRFVHLVECGGGDRLHSGILDLPSASRLRDQEHSCCRNRKGLGSGLIGHSQKMTVAESATAEKKTVGQRS